MLFGNSNINKAASSILLLILFLIHSIKLLHAHPANTLSSKKIYKTGEVVKKNSECAICNYQLARDLDHVYYCNNETPDPERNIFNPGLVQFYHNLPYSAFEGRGPPASI